MRLCLVEDHAVAGLEPLTLSRPAYELRLGSTTLGAKIARAFGVGAGPARRAAVIRSHLVSVQRERDTATTLNDPDWLARGQVTVANARWVPPEGLDAPVAAGSRPWVGYCKDQPACAVVGPDWAARLSVVKSCGVETWFEEMARRGRTSRRGR